MKDPLRGLPQGSSKEGLRKGSPGTVAVSDKEDDREKDCETPQEAPTTGFQRNTNADDLHKARVKIMKKKRIWINLSNCKQSSVRRVAVQFGLKEVGDDEEWTLFWTDYSVSLDKAMELKRYQKINHFPGMNEICRKDLLARNLNRMLKLYPKDYNIFPKTWCLPSDYHEFMAYSRARKSKTFICKPDSECQGRGIFLTRNTDEVKPGEDMVCQVYIPKPFILDGFKFDLRLYILITSCDPLRIYFYDEGLIRFATTKYSEPTDRNVEDVCMHLTNYSINKHSKNFVRDENKGSKRSLIVTSHPPSQDGYQATRSQASVQLAVRRSVTT